MRIGQKITNKIIRMIYGMGKFNLAELVVCCAGVAAINIALGEPFVAKTYQTIDNLVGDAPMGEAVIATAGATAYATSIIGSIAASYFAAERLNIRRRSKDRFEKFDNSEHVDIPGIAPIKNDLGYDLYRIFETRKKRGSRYRVSYVDSDGIVLYSHTGKKIPGKDGLEYFDRQLRNDLGKYPAKKNLCEALSCISGFVAGEEADPELVAAISIALGKPFICEFAGKILLSVLANLCNPSRPERSSGYEIDLNKPWSGN